jgi:hypothetical protein
MLVSDPQYDVRKTWLWNLQTSPGALSIPGGKLSQQTNNNIILYNGRYFRIPWYFKHKHNHSVCEMYLPIIE